MNDMNQFADVETTTVDVENIMEMATEYLRCLIELGALKAEEQDND